MIFYGHKGAILGNVLLAALAITAVAPSIVVRDDFDAAAQEVVATEATADANETEVADAGILFEEKTESATATKATTKKTSAKIAVAKKTDAARKADAISILGRTIKIKLVADTKVDAGKMVALYGNGFLYGHNTSAVFGVLSRATAGTSFSVTLNNETQNYQVAKTVVLTKEDAKRFMYALTKMQSFDGENYDLVLMTCAGEAVGQGDATHRRIVLARKG